MFVDWNSIRHPNSKDMFSDKDIFMEGFISSRERISSIRNENKKRRKEKAEKIIIFAIARP